MSQRLYLNVFEFENIDFGRQSEKAEADKIEAMKQAAVLSKHYPFEPIFVVDKYDLGGWHYTYESYGLFAKYQGLDFYASSRGWRSEKFRLHCKQRSQMENRAKGKIYYTFNEPEPNRIGVPTRKKLIAWMDYCLKDYLAFEKELIEAETKRSYFLKLIEGENVRFSNDGNSGTVDRNGIRFSFTINGNYISEKVEISPYSNFDFNTFLLLADNKLRV